MGGKVSTRELGLILGVRLMKTADLHYGFWTDDLEVSLANLPRAQENYSRHLLGRIPAGVRTVLDVGCGTGNLAALLAREGYQVEAISPSPALTRLARERLGPAFPVHETTFEAFRSDKTYDLVLFSESFQYIRMADSLPGCLALLREGGCVLISDFFLTDAPGESPIRGGHDLAAFYRCLEGLPFTVELDEDITRQTAPNLDLLNGLLRDYAVPTWETLGYWMRQNHPWLARLGWRLLRRKLEKLQFKYFSDRRTGAAFATYKSYRCLLLRKHSAAAPGAAADAAAEAPATSA